MSWQARLHLNKRVKFYSLFLGNLELGRRYVNIGFLTPAKLRSGNYIFKYSLLRPGTVQKRGLFIHIFASSPRHSSEAGTIHSNICFLAPVEFKSGAYTFKYLLSRPGETSKRGLFIQIFASSPRHSSEAGTIHSYIRFFAPAQFKCGDYSFIYSLLRPGTVQKRGLYIQIFASSPRWGSEAGLILSNICFLARHSLEVDSIYSLIGIFKYI